MGRGEREKEKYQCEGDTSIGASCTCPDWGQGTNLHPMYLPLSRNRTRDLPSAQDSALTTEQHWPGPARWLEQGSVAVHVTLANSARSHTPMRDSIHYLFSQALGCWLRGPGFILREPAEPSGSTRGVGGAPCHSAPHSPGLQRWAGAEHTNGLEAGGAWESSRGVLTVHLQKSIRPCALWDWPLKPQ